MRGCAGLSDWLDGYVARRFNQQSKLGSYLDPIADKVLLGCVVGALGFQVRRCDQLQNFHLSFSVNMLTAHAAPRNGLLLYPLQCEIAPPLANTTLRGRLHTALRQVLTAYVHPPSRCLTGDTATAAGRFDPGSRRPADSRQFCGASEGSWLAMAGR